MISYQSEKNLALGFKAEKKETVQRDSKAAVKI
jgi:hypothetical protein